MADGPDPTATGGAGDEPASADGELVGLSGARGYESTTSVFGVNVKVLAMSYFSAASDDI